MLIGDGGGGFKFSVSHKIEFQGIFKPKEHIVTVQCYHVTMRPKSLCDLTVAASEFVRENLCDLLFMLFSLYPIR